MPNTTLYNTSFNLHKLLIVIALQLYFGVLAQAQIETPDSLLLDTTDLERIHVQEVNDIPTIYSGFEKNLDSLFQLWVVNQAEALRFIQSDSDQYAYALPGDSSWMEAQPLPADSILIARLDSIESIIDLPYNSIVRAFIEVYAVQKRDKVALMLGLADYYFPIFEEILMEKNMPVELKYLAVIESALNPKAVSRVGATGLWQFMYSTGRQYKLEIHSEVDERKDPIKSTYAAAAFLQDLYDMFGDWTLALAAYNCGPGNVRKAIARTGGKRNFWDIYYRLPRETRGYVPAFIAATYVFNYYEEHGYKALPLEWPLATDTLWVNREIHLSQIADVLNLPVELLEDLNPQYQRGVIPAKKKSYALILPADQTVAYLSQEDSIFAHKRDYWFDPARRNQAPSKAVSYGAPPKNSVKLIYEVKAGDNLGAIAQQYKVRINDLRYWNNIRRNLIRIGQKLVIYVPESRADEFGVNASHASPSNASGYISVSSEDYERYEIYTVRSGDNLWDIAKKFPGVSFEDIKRLNGLTNKSRIQPGQKLRVYEK